MRKETRITLFSTRHCGYCRQAKQFLKRHRLPFIERDVEHDPRAYKAFRQVAGAGVPLIIVGSQRLQGFNASALRSALQQAGFDV
jgi:glutaredoxin 3